MSKVDIIIANYQGGSMLPRCVQRIVNTQPRDSYRLYVIDNGSTDSSHSYLFGNKPPNMPSTFEYDLEEGHVASLPATVNLRWDTIVETTPLSVPSGSEETKRVTRDKLVNVLYGHYYDNCVAIKLDKNYGYETAVNIGLAASGTGWDWATGAFRHPHAAAVGNDVILMGSDVMAHDGLIEKLQRAAYAHPRIGIVGAKLMKMRGSRMFVVGGGYTSGAPLHYRGFADQEGPWDYYQQCPWVTFSCVYIKRAVVRDVDMMDMSYYFYSGDADYCRRARQKEWAGIYAPEPSCVHGESITCGLVRREIGEAEWDRRVKADQRFHALKWRGAQIPLIDLSKASVPFITSADVDDGSYLDKGASKIP